MHGTGAGSPNNYPLDTLSIEHQQLRTGWTPVDVSGAGLAITNVSARAVRTGYLVYLAARVTFPVNADGANAQLGGIPATFAPRARVAFNTTEVAILNGPANSIYASFDALTSTWSFFDHNGVQQTNAQLSGLTLNLAALYDQE